MFVNGSDWSDFDSTQPTLFILRKPPEDHAYLTKNFLQFVQKTTEHRLMIVGDVSLMFKLQPLLFLWSKLSLTYLIVTMNDMRYDSYLFYNCAQANDSL